MIDKIIENFKFLTLEVEDQILLTYKLLHSFNDTLLHKIESKDDYIDNLKTHIENDCFSRIHGSLELSENEIKVIHAAHIICINLERIADFSLNIAKQMDYLSDRAFINNFDYKSMFHKIDQAIKKIITVFQNKDLSGALEICRSEFNLDMMYKANFDKIISEIEKADCYQPTFELHLSTHIRNLLTVIFMFRYLERIGDSLLNIGEALIFSIIGDRIKIRQVEALEKTLSNSGFSDNLSEIDFSSIHGSRSGCNISRVNHKKSSSTKTQIIFKEGLLAKIKKEKENSARWNNLFAGLSPKVFGYNEEEDSASFLIEFLPGCTFDELILTSSNEVISNAIFILEQIITNVFQQTKEDVQIQTDYIRQLQNRLDAIYHIHPGFRRIERLIEPLVISSSNELISKCFEAEERVKAPFTVLIHGDLNVNNILYNHAEQKINYIDLYRSQDSDYIQDASVFLVSNFRLPIFKRKLRDRINYVINHFYNFFENFAKNNDDKTFEFRMGLALSRSFYTSTRFENNRNFAKNMYLRAIFLMEQIINHNGKALETFKLPKDILFY